MPSLTIENLSKHFDEVRAVDDLDLEVEEGEMLTLLGPSGCGKTTTLRCIAGLERPTAGRIILGEGVVTDIDGGVFVLPEKREMGMVFQSYAVWPHMTLFENVAYPLRARGMPRGDISEKVMNTLKLVQLDGMEHRYSTQISGGQQQRVALARSLVSEPSLLLFDEPLSNLDANLRVQMRLEIRELQERLNFTAVYVTHDQTEAMALSDRIAIMDHGVMQQIADPREIYNRPQNRFVASFMGTTNLFEGAKKAGAGGEPLVLSDEGIEISIGDQHMPDEEKVYVSIRPEALRLSGSQGGSDSPNHWNGRVIHSTFLGESTIFAVEVSGKTIEIHAEPTQVFEMGQKVVVSAEPERCVVVES